MAIRSTADGSPLHNGGVIIDDTECCGDDCICCDAEELPEELFLTLDQFVIEPGPGGPAFDCDPAYMCEDGDFEIAAIPGAPTGQPGSEIAFSTDPCTDDIPGAGNGSPVSVAAIKIRCHTYEDGASRWYVYSIGNAGITTGHYNDCTGGSSPQFGWRKCILQLNRTILDPDGLFGLGVCPSAEVPNTLCNIIGPAATCDPFYLQGTADLGIWVTPTSAIFVDRCERNVSLRFTVTE